MRGRNRLKVHKAGMVITLACAFALCSFSGCMKADTVGFDIDAPSKRTIVSEMNVSLPQDAFEPSNAVSYVDEPVPTFETINDPLIKTDNVPESLTVYPIITQTDAEPSPTLEVLLTIAPEQLPTATPEITPTMSPTASPSPSPTISVEPVDDEAGYVYAKSANLRKGPGTSYDIVMECEQYEQLVITGKSGEWYRIKINGERGYMLKEFIELGAVPTPSPTPTPKPTDTPKPTIEPTQAPTATPAPTASIGHGNGFTEDELYLLAQLVHREANGTSLEAQKAVANAIYNRVMSSRFPSTVEGVVFQKNQYSPAKDEAKLRSTVPSQTSIDAVIAVFVNGELLLPANVTFFKAASSGTTWNSISFLEYYATIGENAFFADTRDG